MARVTITLSNTFESGLCLTLLLHHYLNANKLWVPPVGTSAGLIDKAYDELVNLGLMRDAGRCELTNKGKVYVDFINKLPLPTPTWVMPIEVLQPEANDDQD